jgi:hypothetical protein
MHDPDGAKSKHARSFSIWDAVVEAAFAGLAYGLYAATKAATHLGIIAAGLLAAAIGGVIVGLSVVVARWILNRSRRSGGSRSLTIRSTVMLLAGTTTLVAVLILLTLGAAYAQK